MLLMMGIEGQEKRPLFSNSQHPAHQKYLVKSPFLTGNHPQKALTITQNAQSWQISQENLCIMAPFLEIDKAQLEGYNFLRWVSLGRVID